MNTALGAPEYESKLLSWGYHITVIMVALQASHRSSILRVSTPFLGQKAITMVLKKKKKALQEEHLQELIKARKAATNKELTEKARKYILRKAGLLPEED